LIEAFVCGFMIMLDSNNEMVKLFRHAKQRPEKLNSPNLRLCLFGKRDNGSRHYNDPSSKEIGGLVIRDIGDSRFDLLY
jgi:hypothetical protein